MSVLFRLATAVQVASLVAHPHLQAQQSTAVGIGVRVRVTSASAGSRSGVVVGLTDDSLVITPSGQKNTIGFRRAEISRLESSAGEHRNGLQGLGIGALIGAGTGALAGFASGDDGCPKERPICGLALSAKGKATIGAVLLGILGGTIGVVAGSLTTSEHWVIAARASVIAPIVDARGRLGLAIRY